MSLLLAALLLAQAPPVDEKKVQELAEKCGAEAIVDREAAMKELMAMGDAILLFLEKAKASLSVDAKACVQKVIDEFNEHEAWAKRLVETDTDGRAVEFEIQLHKKEIDPVKAAKRLKAVVLYSKASPRLRQYALALAQQHQLPDVWPAVLKAVASEPASEGLAAMVHVFQPPPEALPEIMKLIPKVRNAALCAKLLEVAGRVSPDRAAIEECVNALLKNGDLGVKTAVAASIREGRTPVPFQSLLRWWRAHAAVRPQLREAILDVPPAEGAPEVVGLLKSSEPESVQLVWDYIRRQALASAGPILSRADEPSAVFAPLEREVRKWIGGQGPNRPAAIALAAEFRWASAAPEILKCLEDGEADTRRAAVSAAGSLKMTGAAAKLNAMIQDSDVGVRRAALFSLASLGGKDATQIVLAQIRSDDPELQAAAVQSLAMVDSEQALLGLTTDEALKRPITKHALAVLIVKHGATMLHRVMARAQGRIAADELHAQIRLVQSVPR